MWESAPKPDDTEVITAYLLLQGHGPEPEVRNRVEGMSPDWRRGFAKTLRDMRA
jgi:hypothetical protein